MSTFRRLYFEPLKGKYHALFLGDNINNDIEYDTFSTSPVIIQHNRNTKRVLISVFDNDKNEILPDKVLITDENSVEVHFSSPFKGKIHLTTF
jgi:hypothetical protein